MKMWRFIAGLLFPALLLGLVVLFDPAEVQAVQRITMHNKTRYPIDVALVVKTYNGWRVRGWQKIAPYSYKNVTYNDATGSGFRYYAESRLGKHKYEGTGNAPVITIALDRSMNHDARQQPYGSDLRRVRVRTMQGNSVTFLPPQGYQQQQSRNTGWW